MLVTSSLLYLFGDRRYRAVLDDKNDGAGEIAGLILEVLRCQDIFVLNALDDRANELLKARDGFRNLFLNVIALFQGADELSELFSVTTAQVDKLLNVPLLLDSDGFAIAGNNVIKGAARTR